MSRRNPNTSWTNCWSRAGDRIDAADAELLLAHALGQAAQPGCSRMRDDAVADDGRDARFDALGRTPRVAGEPVAYLTGRRGFWTLDLAVTPATLIPRPETELLVELALARMPAATRWRGRRPGHRQRRHRAGHRQRAPDVRRGRHRCQQRRAGRGPAQRAGQCASATSNSARADWLQPLAGERFDLIASNPPYIAEGDPHLAVDLQLRTRISR